MSKSIYDNYFWIPFRNDSGETIPAYSSIKITGVVSGGARTTLTADQPDSTATMFATTGPFSVVADGFGSACVSVHRVAKFTDGLSVGDRCKPKPGDWVMEKSSSGQFVCLGVISETESLALVMQDQFSGGMKLFRAPEGGITGRTGTTMGSATCTVVETDSSGVLTTDGTVITVYNWARFPACKNGDRYGAAGWINAAWVVIAEDCTDDGSTNSPQTMSIEGGSFPELVSFNTLSPMSISFLGGHVEPTTPSGGVGSGTT